MKPLNIRLLNFHLLLPCIVLAVCCGSPAYAEQTALSLDALTKIARQTQGNGKTLPEEARILCGIGQVDGYIVDPDHHDIVLLGRQAGNRPSLHFDDLVLLLRSALKQSEQSYPYCSLDPKPANIRALRPILAQIPDLTKPERVKAYAEKVRKTLGGQEVVVGGVPSDSRLSHLMVNGDYFMKKVTQGQQKIPEIPSFIERSKVRALEAIHSKSKISQPGTTMARFWFHIADGDPKFESSVNGDIVNLASAKVALLTERQRASADGHLHDSGEEDAEMQDFASTHTQQFPKIAERVPEYADLENAYRLLALLISMRTRNAPEAANIDLGYLLEAATLAEPKPMLPELPGLVNYDFAEEEVAEGTRIVRYFFFPMVVGGVSMDTPVSGANFANGDPVQMVRQRTTVLKQKPPTQAMCWRVE